MCARRNGSGPSGVLSGMEMEKPRPANAGDGCLVGVLRVPVKIVAVLVVLPVRVVWDLIVAVARLLNRHVLGPAGRGLRRFRDAVVRPVLRGLGRVAATLLKLVFVWPWTGLWRYALSPVGRGLARLGSAVAAYLLRPLGRGLALVAWALFVWPWMTLWRHVLTPVGAALLTHLLRPLGDGLGRALRTVGRRLLAPLARGVALVGWALGMALFVWPWAWLWRYALVPVGRASAWLAHATGVALVWLLRALFVWPWARLWRYVVVPVAGAAYRYLLAPLGRGAYAYLLAPSAGCSSARGTSPAGPAGLSGADWCGCGADASRGPAPGPTGRSPPPSGTSSARSGAPPAPPCAKPVPRCGARCSGPRPGNR